MKKIVYIFIAASLIFVSCDGKDKVRYDPYSKGQKGKKIKKEVVEKRQKGFDVEFTKKNGVRYVMVTMNGVSGIEAIFDTGCSSMSISEMELLSLIKGETINETDVGVTKVSIADGTELTIPQVRMTITLTDTKGKKHSATAEAGVQTNLTAHVLIGNAIFSQLGTIITIDDNKGIIHFE